jgi:hypothetical protein
MCNDSGPPGREGKGTFQCDFVVCDSEEPVNACTLKINRYIHYFGFYPLWLCEPDEDFYEWHKNVNWKSVRFAESLAIARGGIEP